MFWDLLYGLPPPIVCTSGTASRLPPLEPHRMQLEVRPLDLSDERDIGQWLEIQGMAYGGETWGRREFDRHILNHPHLEVRYTWLAMDGERAVAAASAGVFRRNPRVGVGHLLAVRYEWHGRGVGKHLALYRYHALAGEGITHFESETTPHHPNSILLHFDCGFRPKLRLDPWNSADEANALRRLIARLFMGRLYRRWQRERARSAGS